MSRPTWTLAGSVLLAALLAAGCSDSGSRSDAGLDALEDAGPDGSHADGDAFADGADGASDGGDQAADGGDDPSDGGDGGDPGGCAVLLDHAPVGATVIGPVTLTLTATGAESVSLHHRLDLNGAAWRQVPMSVVGDTWSATVPAEQVTFAGLAYYFVAEGEGCSASMPPEEPDMNPFRLSIWGTLRVTSAVDVYDYLPAVHDMRVVFAKEEQAGQADNVYLFDLRTFEETQVTDLTKPQGAAHIWGPNVVWIDARNQDEDTNLDIYMRDLDAGVEHQVTTDPLGQYGAAFHERILVWRDDRHMVGPIDGDIYLYDLGPDGAFGTGDDGGEHRLTPDPADQTGPDVHVMPDGRVQVVWYDMRDDEDGVCDAVCDTNIYLADSGPDGRFGTADDRGPLQVTSAPNEQTSPAIGPGRIAWRDARDGDWLHPDVYWIDLGPDGVFGTADDGGEQRLDIASVEPDNLDLDGHRLVYDDYRNQSFEIFLYDFDEGAEIAITASAGGQFYPRIHGRAIVWQDTRHNDPAGEPFDDIFVHVLP